MAQHRGKPDPLPDERCFRNMILLCAFIAHHERDDALPTDMADRHRAALEQFEAEGIVYQDGDSYRITRRGLAEWRAWVVRWATCSTNVKHKIIYDYDVEGNRLEERAGNDE